MDAAFLQKAHEIASVDGALDSLSSTPAVKTGVVDQGAGLCDVQDMLGRRCCRTVAGALLGEKDLVCAYHLMEHVHRKIYEDAEENGIPLARVKDVAQPELEKLTNALATSRAGARRPSFVRLPFCRFRAACAACSFFCLFVRVCLPLPFAAFLRASNICCRCGVPRCFSSLPHFPSRPRPLILAWLFLG